MVLPDERALLLELVDAEAQVVSAHSFEREVVLLVPLVGRRGYHLVVRENVESEVAGMVDDEGKLFENTMVLRRRMQEEEYVVLVGTRRYHHRTLVQAVGTVEELVEHTLVVVGRQVVVHIHNRCFRRRMRV